MAHDFYDVVTTVRLVIYIDNNVFAVELLTTLFTLELHTHSTGDMVLSLSVRDT